MRFRMCLLLALLLMTPAILASADTATYGDTLYVFGEDAQPALLTLQVKGFSFDPDTMEGIEHDALPGAVFGIYAKDASGAFVPFPDPSNPLRALTMTTGDRPAEIALPRSVDLYLRQETVPDGYMANPDVPEYTLLSLPQTLVVENRAAGLQGLWLTLTGMDEAGEEPLAGVLFSLEGGGQRHTLTTNEAGKASIAGIAPGEYTLRQLSGVEGFHMDAAEQALTIVEHEPLQLHIRNSRSGFVALRAFGVAMDASHTPRLIPIERAYTVYGENGTSYGVVTPGAPVELPAEMDGREYRLRMEGAASDGYADDKDAHLVTIYPGRTTTLQTAAQSEKGFFTFSHIDAETGEAIAGGSFVLRDASGADILTFETNARGTYVPQAPLAQGAYTLHMARAAEGFRYNETPASVDITPFADGPATQVTMASEPLPTAQMDTPQVASTEQALPSLFESDAELSFTLSLFGGDPPLPISNIEYDYALPEIPGLAVLSERADGATIQIPRRFALPDVQEITSLTIQGTVSYTYSYRIDEDGNEAQVPVSAPFSAVVARFAAAKSTQYALSGVVHDETGAPVSGLSVTAGEETVQTDPTGAFALRSAVSAAALRFDTPEGFGVREAGGVYSLLPLRTLSGTVIQHGGLQGYPLTLQIGDLAPVRPEADGSFTCTGILSDDDALVVQPSQAGILHTVDRTGDSFTVNLYPQATVSGLVQSPSGTPVAQVTATLAGEGAEHTATTGADGRFAIDGLLPGEYTLSFDVPQGFVLNGASPQTLTLSAGDAYDEADASVMQASAIEGTLLDGESPYEQITVTLQPDDVQTTTDAQGRFAFENLAIGAYTLDFDVPDSAVLVDPPGEIAITDGGQRPAFTVHAVRPATIAGRIWHDANDDGYLSYDEGGLPDVECLLYDESERVAAAAYSDADGYFTFDGLIPGSYRIGITLPTDMIFARSAPDTKRIAVDVDASYALSDWYTVASGELLDNLICGAVTAGTITGIVWEDENGDGVLASNEPRIAAAAVELTGEDAVIATAKTDANGAYRFDHLRPADYQVRVTLPEDMLITAQAAGAAGVGSTPPQSDSNVATQAVSLRRWRMEETVNVGGQTAATLSAYVWLDADATASALPDAGYADVTVALYSVRSSSASLLTQQKTDATGHAVFGPLRPGTYQLRYLLPDGANWGFTQGIDERSAQWGIGAPMALENGTSADAPPVGLTKLGTISGIVFEDTDYDGLRGDAEHGLSIPVTLLNAAGDILREGMSGSDGRYAFADLPTGMYSVRFALPDEYAFTKERKDAPSYNSDVPETLVPTAQTDPLHLPAGGTLPVDAGGYKLASLSGAAWHDTRDSGVHSQELPPVEGLTITVRQDGEAVASAVTDARGEYRIDGLAPGAYTLEIALEPHMRFSNPPTMPASRQSMMPQTEESVAVSDPFTLRSGQRKTQLDIGIVLTGAVQGKAIDQKTGGGLAGVSVVLARDGAVLGEAITGADGGYRFENIRPGPAQLTFAAPEGYAIGEDQPSPASIAVAQDEATTHPDLGCLPEAAVEGLLWMDHSASAQWSADKEPLAGLTVTLYQMGASLEFEEVARQVTDETGAFRFDGLLPGEYQLRYLTTSGMVFYEGAESKAFRLGMGEHAEYRAAAYMGASLSGTVWEDTNSDGLHDFNEPPISNVSVKLITPDGSIQAETITDANGLYRFADLPPMACAVRFQLPDAFIFATPVDGGSVVPASDTNISVTNTYTLVMGAKITDVDAGAVRHTRIGDLIWLDENANGLQDTGEPGLVGATIQLWRILAGGQEECIAETTSDANGYYRFDGVRPGTYRISIGIGDGYRPTKPEPGLDQINSKLLWVDSDIAYTDPFVAPSGSYLLTIDAGLVTADLADQLGWFPRATQAPQPTPTATQTPAPQTPADTEEAADDAEDTAFVLPG